jgi:hypothetical protein
VHLTHGYLMFMNPELLTRYNLFASKRAVGGLLDHTTIHTHHDNRIVTVSNPLNLAWFCVMTTVEATHCTETVTRATGDAVSVTIPLINEFDFDLVPGAPFVRVRSQMLTLTTPQLVLSPVTSLGRENVLFPPRGELVSTVLDNDGTVEWVTKWVKTGNV